MRSNRSILSGILGMGLLLTVGANSASAQEGGYAPPPPPPQPTAPDTVTPPPAPGEQPAPPTAEPGAQPYAQPPPPRRRRPRYRPSRWGRFYLGAGGGYLMPGGELGKTLKAGGAYGAWLGWRKRWIGLEVGYLGAQLQSEPTAPFAPFYNEPVSSTNLTASGPRARLSQLTGDVKIFLRLFCSSSIFGRIGVSYNTLSLEDGTRLTGAGYQYGAGIDYRIRLSRRPNLILKLRAEVLQFQAKLAVGDSEDRRSLSGVYAMGYLSLGWSPR